MHEDARPPAGVADGVSSLEQLARLERAASAGGPEGQQALRTLAALAASPSLPKPLLKELRRVLYRLRSRGIDAAAIEGPADPALGPMPARGATAPSARPVLAAASAIDAGGAAELDMVWDVRHDAWLVHAVVSDGRGLEAFEAQRVPRREAAEGLQRLIASGLQALEPGWGALMLAGALRLARERRWGLPRGFVVVQEQLEPALPPAAPDPYGWARDQWGPELRAAVAADPQRVEVWARASATLLGTGEVDWDLDDYLGPLLQEARRQLLDTRLVLLASTRRSVEERLTFRMSEALHAPPVRGRLAARLAYVALRLERAGQAQSARLAAAACAVLSDERSSVRVGVVEALAGLHLAPHVPSRQPALARPGPPARCSPSGLLLPPGGSWSREDG